MNPTLDALIREFRLAQDAAVALLAERLQILRPNSAREWARWWPKACSYRERNGVQLYAHGYGIEVRCGKLIVDFDWGENGEADGFDAWRLFNYHCDHSVRPEWTHLQIVDWVEESFAAGELIHSGSLYYDPHRRATA